MLEDANDYSNVKPYSENKTYNLGDYVESNNIIYKSKVANNTSLLYDTDKWELAPYFATEKYNDLWVFMGSWIAYSIFSYQIEHIAYDANGKGLTTVFEDSGQRTVTIREIDIYKRSVKQKAKLSYETMMKYIKTDGTILESSSGCEGDGCINYDNETIGVAFLI